MRKVAEHRRGRRKKNRKTTPCKELFPALQGRGRAQGEGGRRRAVRQSYAWVRRAGAVRRKRVCTTLPTVTQPPRRCGSTISAAFSAGGAIPAFVMTRTVSLDVRIVSSIRLARQDRSNWNVSGDPAAGLSKSEYGRMAPDFAPLNPGYACSMVSSLTLQALVCC